MDIYSISTVVTDDSLLGDGDLQACLSGWFCIDSLQKGKVISHEFSLPKGHALVSSFSERVVTFLVALYASLYLPKCPSKCPSMFNCKDVSSSSCHPMCLCAWLQCEEREDQPNSGQTVKQSGRGQRENKSCLIGYGSKFGCISGSQSKSSWSSPTHHICLPN